MGEMAQWLIRHILGQLLTCLMTDHVLREETRLKESSDYSLASHRNQRDPWDLTFSPSH